MPNDNTNMVLPSGSSTDFGETPTPAMLIPNPVPLVRATPPTPSTPNPVQTPTQTTRR
jgi:hypothetical protein